MTEIYEKNCHKSFGKLTDTYLEMVKLMALDVRLSRDVDEPWGFELFGGADEEMPLTIEKIEPDSPAKRAGLLNGDTILTINGEEAIDMSLDTACRRVEESGHSLKVGVLRGLYDPVLDYTEPLYDYPPEDLGPQSEPTEVVFQVQRFVEPSDIGSSLLGDGTPGTNLSESRSLTASPYVTPTKPYRPFSTEPVVEIPPLEDPIILNPNYRDQFGKSPIDNDPDYLITANLGNVLGSQARYKLPISEQYDPDGTRFKQNVEIVDKLLKYEKHVKSLSKDLEVVDVTKEIKVCDAVTKEDSLSTDSKKKQNLTEYFNLETKDVKVSEESIRKDSKSIEKQVMFKEEVEEESIREELQQIERMRQEQDSKTIEEIAQSVVEESIERAVSVAQDIKKEIEEEISSSEQVVSESKQKEVSKSVKSEETQEYAERKINRKERIETQEEASQRVARKDIKESETSATVSKKDGREAVEKTSLISEEHEEIREGPRRKESSAQETYESKGEFTKVTKTVTSGAKTAKNGPEKLGYTIGLQTIPSIRGVVHSSYHYDLLLRTFFLHLTDVMVALSRFLLSQPIFNQLTQETKNYDAEERDFKVRKASQEVSEKVEKRAQEERTKVIETMQVVKPVPVKETKTFSQKIEKEKVELVEEKKAERQEIIKPVAVKREQMATEVNEKKSVSGAQMAQRSEKKLSEEMTQKMDAVISEFQTVAVQEDVQRVRRPSSRSAIEEEVMKESDPLEWLSKVDSRRTSQERTEMTKKEFSSSETIERRSSKVETNQETTHKKAAKPPKQTYIAIVESHVYTNKDAIFAEQVADFSETSSVQSADEIKTAVDAIETISTENVAIESAITELETAKIVEEMRELATVKAQAAATVQKIEEVMHDSKEFVKDEIKKETAIRSHDVQEVLIQETKEIIEPVVEIKERKIEKVEKVAFDINESLSVAQSTEIDIQETKSEIAAFDVKKEESVAIVEEEKAVEKAIESKAEVMEPKPVEVVEITETIKIKPKEEIPVHDEYADIKIIKTVPVDAVLSPEIIEVEDISELITKTVVNDVGGGDQVEIGSSKEVAVSSEISIFKPGAKQESTVDVSQVSQVSSQTLAAQGVSAKAISAQSVSAQSVSAQASSAQSVSSVKQEVTASQKLKSAMKATESTVQESSFTAKSVDRKLSVRTDLDSQLSTQSPPSSIDTPSPSTVPPTPLTDEYVFKLNLPLPKSRSATPVPRDSTLSPEDEDPNIVKKKLVPHIETTIERVVYDPPLPTPVGDKVQSPPRFSKPVLNGGAPRMPVYTKPGLRGGAPKRYPVYRKPGLFGGADNPEYSKEEIREIERKSSLLASAIDETIKSIEEYKEEAGINTKKETKVHEYKEEKVTKSYTESYTKEVQQASKEFEEIGTKIEEIIQQCDALAAIDNMESNKSSPKESEGIVTEFEEQHIQKQNIEIVPQPTETSTQIENELKSKEKSVKFENEVKIVEVPKDNEKRVDVNNRLPPEVIAELRTVQSIRVDETKPTEQIIIPPQTYVPEIAEPKVEIPRTEKLEENVEKSDALLGFRPVVFEPENIQRHYVQYDLPPIPNAPDSSQPRDPRLSPYLTETGEQIGTIQGIVDGLEEPVINEELAKQLGKPGISEEKIATLISGEAEMLREAHVMGVDFQKIKPMIDSLKDSEVLKALNEDIERQKAEEKKKDEKKWTTFLQKPKRPVPKVKFGYHGWTEDEERVVSEPYKVQIVKQPKPKVAPDYKPEDFETGPLPWEERAVIESSLPPPEPEEPILIPEVPEFLEAVDPLTESEVPDLEDTGIPLPPPKEATPPPAVEEQAPEPEPEVQEVPEKVVQAEEKEETGEDMENSLAEQLVRSVQGMVDPNATVDQQLAQMRAQLAALAQLPEVIQQSLELVTRQLSKMNQQSQQQNQQQEEEERRKQQEEVNQNDEPEMPTIQEANENEVEKMTIEEVQENQQQQAQQQQQQNMVQEQENLRTQTPVVTEEEIRNEKQRKEQQKLDHESRQVIQHPTPRPAPKRMFGPLDPEERSAVILPGGRRWRKTQDVYDEQLINETLQAQSELIMGKAMGFESDLLPYDSRINFMKYQKPPITLDHLKHSEVYKLIHDEEQAPPRRIDMRTPVVAMSEADYRERCRSMTPGVEKKHLQIPQQFHP